MDRFDLIFEMTVFNTSNSLS